MTSNQTTINKEKPKERAGASIRTEVDTRTEMDSEAGSFRDAKSPSRSVRGPVEDPAIRYAYTIIMRILGCGKTPDAALTRVVSPDDLYTLLDYVKPVFMAQPSCVEVSGPIHICGDIHGQFSDLLRVFDKVGFPSRVNYLFLGDYVDRGKNCLETIMLLFSYKVVYPNHFFLLRGNHECPMINKQYGFYDECLRRYKLVRVWEAFQDIFAWMPLTGIIGERILCMHGGVSPNLTSVDQLRAFKRPNYQPESPSLEVDILWSDPSNFHKGWAPNSRGVSYVFGPDALRRLLNNLNIDLVVRAHQVVQDGYEFFACRRLVTVFTAPFYCGQFDNAAAVMFITSRLRCSFTIMRPRKKIKVVKRRFRRMVPKKSKPQ